MQMVLKSPEVKLMQVVSELRAAATGWQAVHFHLARLLDEYKSEYQVKIALNLAHDLLKNHEGYIFLLVDSSMIVLVRHIEPPMLDKLIFQLRYLYMDDPLAYTEAGQDNPDFCSVYDLRQHWQSFYDLCLRRMAIVTRKQPLAFQPVPEKPPEKPVAAMPTLVVDAQDLRVPVLEQRPPVRPAEAAPLAERPGMNASKLALIERDMRYADIHRVIRRQPVCAVLKDMQVRRVFDELYIHIAHLRQMLHSDVDFLSSRWLFKHLTGILDERMLDLIQANPRHYLDSPVSLNLNVQTLLSSRFAEFDASLSPASKVGIVLEIPVVDVFADMAAFMLTRSEAQKLGYRICLDGLTVDSFASINRDQLGVDLLKVQWNADVQNDLQRRQQPDMEAAVRAAGGNRVILCRCDNRSAVEYGQALGISLFQGRFIDGVLNPTSKIEN